MQTKVRFLKDMYALNDDKSATDLTEGRVYNVISISDCGTVQVFDDAGDRNELYRDEYEFVQPEDDIPV